MRPKHHWSLWVGASALLLWSAATSTAQAEDTIKIGILHSLSGTMAISETILKDQMLMQIADLNAHGGLLGKKVEAVVVDPASNWPLFAEKARELLTKDKVAAVFGCWTSVSRKSVLPVFEELNGLLFYPLADSDDVARSFRDHVARCSDMMSPAGGVLLTAGF
jgi:branched-chain amino acid transport system substrate-binding protein/urea transport system substrate-binding protein